MEVEDAGQGSGKKPAKITIKFKDKDEMTALSLCQRLSRMLRLRKSRRLSLHKKQAKTQAIPLAKPNDKTQAVLSEKAERLV
ncbi:hypothetical protein Tco_1510654 [Tanacetum coccineum]